METTAQQDFDGLIWNVKYQEYAWQKQNIDYSVVVLSTSCDKTTPITISMDLNVEADSLVIKEFLRIDSVENLVAVQILNKISD